MKVKILACLFLFFFLLPPVRALSVEELMKNPQEWDGKSVTVRGEVVGKLEKKGGVWLNLLDNGWPLGVWCTKELAKEVKVVGDYKHIGDTVEVTGVFHARCREHGGEPDLHAENLEVVSGGYAVQRPMDFSLLILSLSVFVAGLFTALFLRLRRKEPFLGYSPESF